MPDRPSPTDRYRQTWAKLDRHDRRRVLRAVNRMRPLENPAEAALAVEYATRQRRLWRRWWWVVPILGGLIASPAGVETALVNTAIGFVFIGLLAFAFSWRAGRAAQVNQEVVDAASKRKRSGGRKRGGQTRKGRRKGGGRRR